MSTTEGDTMTSTNSLTQALVDTTIGVFTNEGLESAVSLAMKDEGTNRNGDTIGPMWLASDPEGYYTLESDARGGWVTDRYAAALAHALGLPFHVV